MTNGHFPVPQEAVEMGLLAAVGQSSARWVELESMGIRADDFVAAREIFQFVSSYLAQYGSLPSSSAISTRFEWHPPLGDFAYWLTEMKRYVLARRVMEAMQESYDKISDPETALSILLERLSLIRSQTTNHIQATDAAAAERFERYLARNQILFNSNTLVGLPTGLKIIDDTKMGWLPGSLVGVYARPGVGKTWWLLWEGAISWMTGKTVLAITPEMPANQLSMRFDVVVAALMGVPIDYNKLIIGDPTVMDNYKLITDAVAQSQRWWTYDSFNDHPISVTDIAALIRQHTPDILLVDGISLLRPENRGQTWEQIKDISYGLKNLTTIHEIPGIISHQAVNSARGRRTEIEAVGRGDDFIMPSLNDAAFGDAFVQACSDVITMCGDPHSRHVNWYSIRKHRERGWQQPLPPRMGLAVDFTYGKMIDLSERGYNPEVVGQEAMRVLGLSKIG